MWSLVSCRPQDMEDVAFSCYAKHQSELDGVVQDILDNPWLGEVDLDRLDDFGPSDLEYIQRELNKRGVVCSLSLVD